MTDSGDADNDLVLDRDVVAADDLASKRRLGPVPVILDDVDAREYRLFRSLDLQGQGKILSGETAMSIGSRGLTTLAR